MYKGTGVSRGLAIARALVISNQEISVKTYEVEDVKSESQRVTLAFHKAKLEIEEFISTLTNEEEKNIINTQLMMLEDPELLKEIDNYIKDNSVNAESAIDKILDAYIAMFEQMPDEYMSQRAVDIKDIKTRVLLTMTRRTRMDAIELDHDCIIVADEILPSYMTQLDQTKVVGFISSKGGVNSHSSIIARSMQKPMIIGLKDVVTQLKTDDMLAIDGSKGMVYVNPDEALITDFEKQMEAMRLQRELLRMLPDVTATKDSHHIGLYANIGSIEDAKYAAENKAEGIGLFRTEFIYLNQSELPSEQYQYEIYKSVLKLMKGKEVVIRTVDIGADKQLDYIDIPKEDNPFLGLRGIRLCLANKEMFKTHLRALLRASMHGEMKIMYPMISSLEELQTANYILEECMLELDEENIPYKRNIKVGMMVEVPSAAINSDILAKHTDFFSIGTNDLIQYTVAVDRMNEQLLNLYSPYDPAVLRLIKLTAENARKNNIPVSICGEAASEEALLPLFLAMGINSLSMSAGEILPLRKKVGEFQLKLLKTISEEVMALETAGEIKNHLKKYMR
ncbi:phosphoenolpyruvate--protein phosphotransferase [Acetoanaerobium sticklandii]|uniref:phosphoenolpyruvate--protein phosphotransferase n=1 Tax=Acetoanaerobium sticklandii TaxID=1511 RepID=UPI003A9264B7